MKDNSNCIRKLWKAFECVEESTNCDNGCMPFRAQEEHYLSSICVYITNIY